MNSATSVPQLSDSVWRQHTHTHTHTHTLVHLAAGIDQKTDATAPLSLINHPSLCVMHYPARTMWSCARAENSPAVWASQATATAAAAAAAARMWWSCHSTKHRSNTRKCQRCPPAGHLSICMQQAYGLPVLMKLRRVSFPLSQWVKLQIQLSNFVPFWRVFLNR